MIEIVYVYNIQVQQKVKCIVMNPDPEKVCYKAHMSICFLFSEQIINGKSLE